MGKLSRWGKRYLFNQGENQTARNSKFYENVRFKVRSLILLNMPGLKLGGMNILSLTDFSLLM
jgi:hypothetical protein